MDKEILEVLKQIQNESQQFRNDVNSKFDKLESQIVNLGSQQNELKTLIVDLEPKNANRHLELGTKIDELRKDLSTLEIVTANNYAYISKLKVVK